MYVADIHSLVMICGMVNRVLADSHSLVMICGMVNHVYS